MKKKKSLVYRYYIAICNSIFDVPKFNIICGKESMICEMRNFVTKNNLKFKKEQNDKILICESDWLDNKIIMELEEEIIVVKRKIDLRH
jgi:hypothetical protein